MSFSDFYLNCMCFFLTKTQSNLCFFSWFWVIKYSFSRHGSRMVPRRTLARRTFPRRTFFPRTVYRRYFPDGQFPHGQFPVGQFPERTIPWTNISQNGYLPKLHFLYQRNGSIYTEETNTKPTYFFNCLCLNKISLKNRLRKLLHF